MATAWMGGPQCLSIPARQLFSCDGLEVHPEDLSSKINGRDVFMVLSFIVVVTAVSPSLIFA